VSTYKPPLDDIKFCIRHLANIDGTLAFDAFEGIEVDDLEQVLDEAGKFAADVIAPTNVPGDEQSCSVEGNTVRVPAEFADVHTQFVENGWQSVAGNPEYDGMGLPRTIAFAVAEMCQTANLAYSLMPMLTRDAANALEEHGNDALKSKYLSKIVTGEWAGTMILTEPQAGSDLSAITTTATPDGDAFRLAGTKIYITWGDHELSENIIHFVLARIDGAAEGIRGLSLFLVPKFMVNDDGSLGERNDIYCTSVEHKLGIHGSPTCVLNLGDNDGAIGYLVGEEGKGLNAMFTMMNNARMEVGLQGIAVSERSYQLARTYALDRIQGRAPGQKGRAAIIHHADVRRMIMLMRAQIEAMRALSYAAAAQDDVVYNGSGDAQAAADIRLNLLTPVVKTWCTEIAQEVTSLGIQVHGGMGFVEETGAAQHYRDARILTIYEGTSGIQASDFTGRKVLGDEGRALRALLDELQTAASGMQETAELATIGAAVSESLDLVTQGMEWLLANAADDPQTPGAASFNFVMLAGCALSGAYLAQAAAAAHAVGGSFGSEKVATAAFYCAHVLPRAYAFAHSMMADPAVTMAIPAEAFAD
jgi:acyl-CoA dehydrogenase